MKTFSKTTIFQFLLLTLLISPAYAQRNCSTMENLDRLKMLDPRTEQNMQMIEEHTQNYIANLPSNETAKINAVYTIPVVVHVLYRTSSENISNAQILSQIDILNQDYRRTNSDKVNTPSTFAGVAADVEVEFCLATKDPNGNATSGITRTSTSTTSWSANDAMKYTSSGGKDAWPSADYLNIWVCNLGGGLLGYAQFPGSGSAATDGVVIGYNYFGNTGNVSAPFNKGRTATHEVGHWLNLRHIWGDANCGNDYVSDTPTQQQDNSGCPSHPHVTCSNGTGDMFMNYMDYTNDACMNVFTQGQKSRMRAVLSTGGFRNSLLSSTGCGGGGGGSSSGYCGSQGSNSSYEWIAQVKFANINKTSGNDGGYADYTSTVANVTAGSSYSLTLAPGFSGQAYNEYFRIWMDLNHDQDFDDAGELVFNAGSMTSTTLNSTLTIPSSAAAGQTRMRVQMKYNGSGTQCETFQYGEVEDYTVNVSTAAACNTPSGLSSSSVTTNSATVSWSNTGANSYKLRYKASSATSWTNVSTSSTSYNLTGLSPATTYSFSVQSICTGSSSNFSSNASFTTQALSGGGGGSGYCTSTGQNSSYEWIQKVQVGSINNTSGNNNGYQDYTSISTSLTKGNSTTAVLTPGFSSSSYNEYWRIFIDLNGDGDFTDTGEMVYDQGGMSSSAVTASFQVPTSATATSTRMRIQMKYNAAGTSCETFQYGEVEDYTVQLVGGMTSSCTDAYESNNSLGASATLTANSTYAAYICPSGDNDYYKFTNSSSKPNISIDLSNLAGDYDVKLYNSSGSQIGISQNGGTSPEHIGYNTISVGTYYVYVYGYNGAYSSTQKYSLKITTSSASFRESAEYTSPKSIDRVEIYPNPTSSNATLNYYCEDEGRLNVVVMDLLGQKVWENSMDVRSGNNEMTLETSGLSDGMYIVRMERGGVVQNKKLEIRR